MTTVTKWLGVLLAAMLTCNAGTALAQDNRAKPDLIVMLAIDQFGSLLFDKWRPTFQRGLKRIADGGVIYANAYQSHGITETCAGHSTLLTGKQVYCVEDAAYTVALNPKQRKVGPALLATSTFGDWLKEQNPQSRVVVVSGKDRSSVTMGGRKADGVFWYIDGFGFTTFVAADENAETKLQPLAKLNDRIAAEAASVPPWTYANEACRALESEIVLGKQTWKLKLPPEAPAEEGKPPGKVRPIHIMDPLTLEAARELVAYHKLGKRGQTDLLAISLSATDFIGHGYGTQGPEMCDQMYRLDAMIGDFLTYLDGYGARVMLVVTGDHGGSDFPERLAQQGDVSARRISPAKLLADANAQVKPGSVSRRIRWSPRITCSSMRSMPAVAVWPGRNGRPWSRPRWMSSTHIPMWSRPSRSTACSSIKSPAARPPTIRCRTVSPRV